MIITICGSLKFQQEMISIAQKMTFLGHCVITPIFQTSKNPNYTEEQIQKLKNAHLKKIDISDAILVVNVNNYIGESTRLEIEYAEKHYKQVLYYTNIMRELEK